MLPIFMTFLRSLLWRCGILDKFFNRVDPIPDGGMDMKYGSVPKRFYDKDIDEETVNAFTNTIMDIGSPDDVFGTFEDAFVGGILESEGELVMEGI